ncbi:DUF1640 domain-containing protein [Candidatus Magnetaquicoccus inordinatus]|uniref:DUF1640 domain-containing protein n=1 Tax=Candidatus Magnetaquicoccus inordinatus TaxID=2496818 RepID=UPI00102CE5B5|nr:DUF1640 domain-containing protein [Candidatus Magnetaquicoccus inordinatus]
MIAITFDTLKFVETLKASGFDEPQAKGMATAILEVQKSNLDEVATKADIQDVKRDIKELELRITADMAKMHGELATMRWGMAIIVGGIIALVLKSFFPH